MLVEFAQSLVAMISSLPPAAGFVAIIAATFILEDVAIAGTGLLASSNMIDPVSGAAALLVGIILGDFGLYALGYGASKLPGLRRYVDTKTAIRLKGIGSQRTFSLVFSTRFVPGMRLPTYTGLGYVGASFWRFFYAVLFAVSIWTITLYSLIVFLGQNILELSGPWKWAALIGVLTTILLIERRLLRNKRKSVL